MLNDSMVDELRSQHPWFKYQASSWKIVDGVLQLNWQFFTEPDIQFAPSMLIPLPTNNWQERLPTQLIDQLVFHIGLVEMFSYWKATASPQIAIEAGYLNDEQLMWWHQLLLKGMGEYFFLNQINFKSTDFITLSCTTKKQDVINQNWPNIVPNNQLRFLVPIGGGKDSIVAMELLRQWRQHQPEPVGADQLTLFAINPTAAATAVINQSGYPAIIVERHLDPLLFKLNQQGFLNGHTPFSALLSFTSLLTAVIYNFSDIALGNEQSANEGNLQYLGQAINHQYSKSFEYESLFRQYLTDNLQTQTPTPLPNYFSLLRPFNELQIAQLFSQQAEAYLPIFRSCNRGQATNTWCCSCAKCLFAFTILFPFLGEQQMTAIFGQNLFENQTLLTIALDLIGETKNKPFDCVGTYQESQVAFSLCTNWYLKHQLSLPILLSQLRDQYPMDTEGVSPVTSLLLKQYNQQNFVPSILTSYLKQVAQIVS